MSEHGEETVVILGVTSAVARALAGEFARAGNALIIAARDAEDIEIIGKDLRVRYHVPVTDLPFEAEAFDAHETFVRRCIETAGNSLRGVVLCLGFMDEQERAQADFAVARRTIDVNLTAAISVLERFAAHFEQRKAGFIAGLSSVAGDRGRATNYIYGASKAGLTTYLAGLRNRLHNAGVQVTTIKPGFMDTKMTFGLPLPKPLTATPEQAARAIHRAIARKKDSVYVLWYWRIIMLIIRAIPEWQFKKMRI
jgi:short-subunit dehydrogenase